MNVESQELQVGVSQAAPAEPCDSHPQTDDPAEGVDATEPTDPTTNPDYWRDVRVMLLDDDQEDGERLIEALKEIGIKKIMWVKFAARAYYQLIEDQEMFPDILVTELVLTGSSGLSLLARLRSSDDELLKKLPAVVITINDNPNIFRRATNQNISAFLRKPASTAQLREALVRARTGHIIDIPLDFGRSWIDEIEDEQDKAEALPQPSLFKRLLAFLWKPKNDGIDIRT